MAGPSVASFLPECRISASQEEVLANLGGGWERSGLYSLDETPSQNFLNSSPPRVQQNSLSLHAEPPASYEGDSGSETSESVDGEGDMEFTQEPVEWISPPSSLQVPAGGEGNDGMAKEDSGDAAFESDRSQSPSQDWHGQTEQSDPQVQIPNLGVSAEFLTQPVSGVMEFQFASSEDLEDQILRRETIPEAEFRAFPGSSLLLTLIPENAVSGVDPPVVVMESSLQPFTQPAVETQSLEPLPLESLNKLQVSSSQTQLGGGKNEIVHDTTLLDKEIARAEEPEPVQQGSGRDELVKDAPALDNDNECAGEQMPQETGGDGLSSDSQMPVDDGKNLRLTEHMQEKDESHVITKDDPSVEVQRGDPGPSDKAQPATQIRKVVELGTGKTPSDSDEREQIQRRNGDTSSSSKSLKRVNCTEELHGRQKLQRTEASPVRVRSFPKTVMDVVRSRSRSLPNSLVGDECNILSIIMRAGVSFPPFVHEKRSV